MVYRRKFIILQLPNFDDNVASPRGNVNQTQVLMPVYDSLSTFMFSSMSLLPECIHADSIHSDSIDGDNIPADDIHADSKKQHSLII